MDTIKDLRAKPEGTGIDWIDEKSLKRLAVKRIKEYLDGLSGYIVLTEISDYLCVWKKTSGYKNISDVNNVIGRVEELVEVFNITWEDLK